MKWLVKGSIFSLSLILAGALSAHELLVRKINTDESQNSRIEKMNFQTEEERDLYIQNLDPQEYEWEVVQNYKIDELSDPLLANQWAIYPNVDDPEHFSGADIDAVRAWEVVKDVPNVIVYIMDSGIDDRDPDLQGRVLASYNALKPSESAFDDNSHGTHVASIISAVGNNRYGIKGVVPGNIQIVVVKFLGASSSGDSNAAIEALDWIYKDMKARRAENSDLKFILSNSWGGGYSKFLEEKMKALSEFDYLPITSAGNLSTDNDSKPYYPCQFKLRANTCVGATDQLDRKADFSGYGSKSVHLMAPGVQIQGIVPGKMAGGNYISDYKKKNGTSQAVPHVSGVAALVWAANPKLAAMDVQEILVNSVDRLPGGESESISGGRLNAYRAVLMATGQDPSMANRSFSQTSAGGGGCSLSVESPSQAQLPLILFSLIFASSLLALRRRRS